MFASLLPSSSVIFVSKSSLDTVETYGLRKRVEAVRDCRTVGKKDMKYNDLTPRTKVDPESYTVVADDEVCKAEPAESLPLSQQFFVY